MAIVHRSTLRACSSEELKSEKLLSRCINTLINGSVWRFPNVNYPKNVSVVNVDFAFVTYNIVLVKLHGV